MARGKRKAHLRAARGIASGDIRQRLTALIAAKLGARGVAVELAQPRRAGHGDLATTAAFAAAKELQRSPEEIAAKLAQEDYAGLVERAEVAGRGFLNLWVSPRFLAETLAEVLARAEAYGAASGQKAERVQVELVSANPTGPVTVAAARNGALGDAVARLLAFAGHEVAREYYVNDVGSQIDLFRRSVANKARGRRVPKGGYKGPYVKDLGARLGADQDPLPIVVSEIESSLARFGVGIDSWTRQSELEPALPALFERLADDLYEADGATLLRTQSYGDSKDRVVIRQDGRPTYFAADIVYLDRKLAQGFDRVVYVLGADHIGYVARLKAAAKALGHDPARVEVLLYQLVRLQKGGQRVPMSKRDGTYVTLDDLTQAIGPDAARWHLLAKGPDQEVVIDLRKAKERNRQNPVYYVQYAHARSAAVLRKAALPREVPTPAQVDDYERELALAISAWPEVAKTAAERRAPQLVCDYTVSLADSLHRFYHHDRVLGSQNEPFRLALVAATRQVLANALGVLGVSAPDTM